MTWMGWIIIAIEALSTFVTITTIGKPREPMTPNMAGFILVFNSLLVFGIFTVGTGKL